MRNVLVPSIVSVDLKNRQRKAGRQARVATHKNKAVWCGTQSATAIKHSQSSRRTARTHAATSLPKLPDNDASVFYIIASLTLYNNEFKIHCLELWAIGH